jgi:hypothetical protein
MGWDGRSLWFMKQKERKAMAGKEMVEKLGENGE